MFISYLILLRLAVVQLWRKLPICLCEHKGEPSCCKTKQSVLRCGVVITYLTLLQGWTTPHGNQIDYHIPVRTYRELSESMTLGWMPHTHGPVKCVLDSAVGGCCFLATIVDLTASDSCRSLMSVKQYWQGWRASFTLCCYGVGLVSSCCVSLVLVCRLSPAFLFSSLSLWK